MSPLDVALFEAWMRPAAIALAVICLVLIAASHIAPVVICRDEQVGGGGEAPTNPTHPSHITDQM